MECCWQPSQTQIGPHQVTYEDVAWPIYKKKELEQWNISFHTIVTKYNGPLKAVDCHIREAGYDMVIECWLRPSQIDPHQDIQQGCSKTDTDKDASILSWPAIMGHYKLWIAIFTA
eukprot:scaffold23080_cov75-Skeletonema_dohrnii-CCMP3373.AAC.1